MSKEVIFDIIILILGVLVGVKWCTAEYMMIAALEHMDCKKRFRILNNFDKYGRKTR